MLFLIVINSSYAENIICNNTTNDCINQYSEKAINLTKNGNYFEAEKQYKIALSFIVEPDKNIAEIWANRSYNFQQLNEYSKAEKYNQLAIDFFNSDYENDDDLAKIFNNQGLLLDIQGKHTDALEYFIDSIAYKGGIENLTTSSDGIVVWNLARQYFQLYQYKEAEREANRAINIFGNLPSNTESDKSNLAKLYAFKALIFEKNYNLYEAKIHAQKAMDTIEPVAHKKNNDYADILRAISRLEAPIKRELLLQESIKVYEDQGVYKYKVKGYKEYGDFLNKQDRYDEAEKYYKKTNQVWINIPNYKENTDYPPLLALRAKNLCDLKKYDEGIELINKSISSLEKQYSFINNDDFNPEILEKYADYKSKKAKCLKDKGDNRSALEIQRESSGYLQNILQSKNINLDPEYQLQKRKSYRDQFLNHIELIESLGLMNEASYFEESLEIAQLAQNSITSLAIKERTARSDNPERKERAELQRHIKELQQTEAEIITLKNRSNNQNEIETLKRRKISINKRLKRSRRIISNKDGDYIKLITPKPLTLENIQINIRPNELVINFIVLPKKILAWGISNNNYYFYATDEAQDISKNISILREALEKPAKIGIAPKDLNDFPFSASYYLYKSLLDPFFIKFKNTEDLLVIPDGPLHSIPLSTLITQEIKNYSDPNWLIKDKAISILPSLETLVSLNVPKINSLNEIKFLGFGNPLLSQDYRVDNTIQKRSIIRNFSQVADLPSLPNTQKELESMATNFIPENISLFLGKAANEDMVKNYMKYNKNSLEDFNIIAFATHAISTNINSNLIEPALIMTPVSSYDPNNDGILTASDINKLNLNADLVILSACNTANSYNESNDSFQAYAGLAESFFFAGTKAVLATHWEVETISAAKITTTLISSLSQNENLSYSQALKSSILNLIENNKIYQHPYYWSAFLVIGNK